MRIRKKKTISLHINLIDTAVISILEMKKLRHGEVIHATEVSQAKMLKDIGRGNDPFFLM